MYHNALELGWVNSFLQCMCWVGLCAEYTEGVADTTELPPTTEEQARLEAIIAEGMFHPRFTPTPLLPEFCWLCFLCMCVSSHTCVDPLYQLSPSDEVLLWAH